MTAAAGPGIQPPYHHIGPLSWKATLENYERLKLQHLASETRRKHHDALEHAFKKFGWSGLLYDDAVKVAVDLYPHMSMERSRTMRRLTRQAIEDFRAWHLGV